MRLETASAITIVIVTIARSICMLQALTSSSFIVTTKHTTQLLKRNSSSRYISRSSVFRMSAGSTTQSSSETAISTSQRIDALNRVRGIMGERAVDAFIVPTDDPHMSEYAAPYFGRREFISGFTGSAGTALILRDKALLFVDGRYHNQADLEVDLGAWTVMKVGLKDVPGLPDFLSKNLNNGSTVAVDPSVHSAAALTKMSDSFASKQIKLQYLASNPVDAVWPAAARPLPPSGMLRVHPVKYAGVDVAAKLADVRAKLAMNGVHGLAVTSLDEICYVYNIRGCDVPCNPVAISYAFITADKAFLFVDAEKVDEVVGAHLLESGVEVLPYDSAISTISGASNSGKIWVDSKTANYKLFSAIKEDKRVAKDSPLVIMKARKNEAELRGMRDCHLRDGAAMAEFFSWLEEEIQKRDISEIEIDERVCALRASFGNYLEPSFDTIAGVGSNGAIIHYRAVPESCKMLTKNDLLLLDSGGQYLDGTTDVTRTVHMGSPSEYQKEMFTRVLKGHIGIDSRVFPQGTAGCLLDSYAREHLWAVGKDFIHGVGHGVGAALNVHEGPHRISRMLDPQPFLPGMIISNEPGYYETGNFGIRIENLLECVERSDLPAFGGLKFLGFERLTHIPIQQKLISVPLLSDKDIAWLNKYNQDIRERVGPLLKTDKARQWLDRNTADLNK